MPKGVLWRQHDIFMTSFGGRDLYSGKAAESYAEIAERAAAGHGNQAHGASAAHSRRRTVGRHDGTHHGPIGGIRLGGGSPGRRRRGRHDRTRAGDGRDGGRRRHGQTARRRHRTRHRRRVVAGRGGQRRCPAHPGHQATADRCQARRRSWWTASGSSETGAQLTHMSAPGAVSTGTFKPGPDTFVVAEDLGGVLEHGHEGIGWLAQRGYVPLGYKGDAVKTAATFPVDRRGSLRGAGRPGPPSRGRRHRAARP